MVVEGHSNPHDFKMFRTKMHYCELATACGIQEAAEELARIWNLDCPMELNEGSSFNSKN